jgi:NADPH-dependent ferric siderophore reductase
MPDAQPATTRVRHPLWFRRLTVRRVEALSPRVRRVILGGDDLEGFTTRSFDDHVKLFFPDAAGDLPDAIAGDTAINFPEGVARPQARDFTRLNRISADDTPLTSATRRGSSQWVRTLLDIGRPAPVS